MKKHARSSLLVVLGLLSACAASRPTDMVNIVFTPSIATEEYASWDFDLADCRDTGDPRVDDALVRRYLLAELQSELERLGYAYRPEAKVDFLVSYQLWITSPNEPESFEKRGRGRIVLKDVATGRFVWRGERIASITQAADDDESIERIRLFVRELLQHTRPLSGRAP